MKIDIQTLQDTFKLGFDTYEESRKEALRVDDLFHNRHYTIDEEAILDNRGQPKETFNIIKLFNRQLIGYYSTIINNIKVSPRQYSDITVASLLNDTLAYVQNRNSFDNEGDKVKSDGFLSGLFCMYTDVIKTDKVDQFGRPEYEIVLEHIPSTQIVLDPMSTRSDYKDARFIHRFKWIPEEEVKKLFGTTVVDKLDEYFNNLEIDEAEFEFKYGEQFQGYHKQFNNYLVVHTIIEDENGKLWSIYWCQDEILSQKEVTYNEKVNPYRVVKLADSSKAEFYGVYHDILETQRAINQAILQIQLLVNSDKVLVQKGAVENIESFKKSFNRVNSIIEVVNLNGIKISNASPDIANQYNIIDKAFDRIQRVLGINDSFLGMAYASDSGRKVKLQQNSTMVALRYVTKKLELFYKLIGEDLTKLIKQYYTSNQVLRIADEAVGERWIEINRPLMLQNNNGQVGPVYDEVLDDRGEPQLDKYGRIVMEPVNDLRTSFMFTDVDIEVSSNAFNDEDEKNQLMLETMLSGSIGNALMTVNPAGYMKAASLSVKSMKSKYSQDIATILDQTASMLTPQPQMQSNLGMGEKPNQPGSESLSLPQNTRELSSGY